MLKAREITKELVAERVASAARRHVGRGKEYGYADFADLVATDQRTVESWCRGESSPHLFAWLRLAAVLPPAFTAELLEIVGLTGVREADPGLVPAGKALAEMSEAVAVLAAAQADGRIDHAERPSVIRELEESLRATESLLRALREM